MKVLASMHPGGTHRGFLLRRHAEVFARADQDSCPTVRSCLLLWNLWHPTQYICSLLQHFGEPPLRPDRTDENGVTSAEVGMASFWTELFTTQLS